MKTIHLDQYISKLRDQGVKQISDLELLSNKTEIEALASEIGITNIVEKKKFVNAVKENNGIKDTSEDSEPDETPEMPEGGLEVADQLEGPDISPPDENLPKTGASEVGDDVLVENLSNSEKAQLFEGARLLLNGRFISQGKLGVRIEKSRYRLFDLRHDIDFEKGVMHSLNQKQVFMDESYSAKQKSLTEAGYYSASAQIGVAEIGGFSSEFKHSTEQQEIKTNTSLSLTASSRMYKAKIFIDTNVVEYNEDFLKELDGLLKSKNTNIEAWKGLTARYGLFYITQCDVGGSAYSSKTVNVSDEKERSKESNEFRASFTATTQGVTGGGGFGHGSSTEIEQHAIDKKTAVSLSCHGGRPALCSCEDFGKWEASVDTSFKLWDVVEICETKPFYYLLDESKQKQVEQLMPEIMVNEIPVDIKWDMTEKSIIAISHKGKYLSADSSKKPPSLSANKGYNEIFTWVPEKGNPKLVCGGYLYTHSGAPMILNLTRKTGAQSGAPWLNILILDPMSLLRDTPRTWPTLFTVTVKNDGYTFKDPCSNVYMGAADDSSVRLEATEALEYEIFKVEVIEK